MHVATLFAIKQFKLKGLWWLWLRCDLYVKVFFSQTRETDTARLEEELGATKAREIQAETRLKTEIRLRNEEMERVREEHQVLVSV